MIDEGLALVEPALKASPRSPYAIQAAIAALHDPAAKPADTDWRQIVALYAYLMRRAPSPATPPRDAISVAASPSSLAGAPSLNEASNDAPSRPGRRTRRG